MIIVTGMHRSGTSMITNLLLEIGGQMEPASTYVQEDHWNQRGYYENKAFVILNNSILIGDFSRSSAGLRHPPEKRKRLTRILMSVSNLNYLTLLISPGWIHERADKRKAEMAVLAQEHHGKIVKDPRFSLLIGSWCQVEGINKVVFCFRHPNEVANSLKKRYFIPTVLGYRLWSFHNEMFLREADCLDVSYVNYNNFFDPNMQYRELQRLYAVLGEHFDPGEAHEIKAKIIRSKYKNYSYQGGRLPARVSELYARLLRQHAA